MLEKFCEQWGYSRGHAIKLLSGKGAQKAEGGRRGRPARYGEEVLEPLETLRQAGEQMCPGATSWTHIRQLKTATYAGEGECSRKRRQLRPWLGQVLHFLSLALSRLSPVLPEYGLHTELSSDLGRVSGFGDIRCRMRSQ
ncbi:MAG: hypothetical protein PHP75_04785 [Methylacidiphilaceae bacterium]|nr:hypothetical protein [Candidatus Methylacidiphilaceae bacterium]